MFFTILIIAILIVPALWLASLLWTLIIYIILAIFMGIAALFSFLYGLVKGE